MTDIKSNNIPVLVDGVDLTSHKLLPKEGYVLSQIDGNLTVENLKLVTGLPENELNKMIAKFLDMELVVLRSKDAGSESVARRVKLNKQGDERSLEEKVAELYINIDNIDHFSLFGLDRDATLEDIKTSYHRLTKEYHPDRLFRRGSEELRERLQYVFANINEAYKVLSNGESRRKYEKFLKESYHNVKTRMTSVPGKKNAEKKPSGPPVPPPRQNILNSSNPFSQTVLKAKRIYEGALDEIKRKNYSSARQNLRIAAALDPFNKVYTETINKINGLESKAQACKYYEDGMEKERSGQFDDAVRIYREATLLDGENPRYYTKWARILIEHKNNAIQAKAVIQKAFEFDDKDPEQYLVMGLVLKAQGQHPQAQAKFEQGIKIDPKNKDLQKELKKIKKGK